MKVTVDEILLEGNWSAAAWSPRIASDASFSAWVLTLAERAAAILEWRVGATHYSDTTEPKATVLMDAEMHLCQELLLQAAAVVADVAAPATPAFQGTGLDLRAAARSRRQSAEELIAPYDQGLQRTLARPRARTGSGTPPLAEHRFDERHGLMRAE